MLICSQAILDGLFVGSLKFKVTAITHMQQLKISMFYVFQELKNGKFELVKKVNSLWIVRSKKLEMIVNIDQGSVESVKISHSTPYDRIKTGKLISPSLYQKITNDILLNSSAANPNDYLSTYLFLSLEKKIVKEF